METFRTRIVVYDLEIANPVFIYGDYDTLEEKVNLFVISRFRDDRLALKQHLQNLIQSGSFQAGFNNLDYDYPLLHKVIYMMRLKKWETMSVEEILLQLNEKNKQLIPDDKKKSSNKYGRNYNIIKNPYINQIDLYKILHWDNPARRTSLKKAQINMRFPNVQEFDWKLFENEYTLELEQQIIDYWYNDIESTKQLYYIVRGKSDKITVNFPGLKKWYVDDRLKFRQILSQKYGINLTNASDVKIGEEVAKSAYLKKTGNRWEEIRNKATYRTTLYVKDLIPNYIRKYFKDKTLIQLLNVLDNSIIDVNKPKLEHDFIYGGIKLKFGLGGLHSADFPTIYIPEDDECMQEIDGASQYPSAMISLGVYPEHLGPEWNYVVVDIRDDRVVKKRLGKEGDIHAEAEALALKYALNGGLYGKLGDKYNYQFDLLQLYRVTFKCQLDIILYMQLMSNELPEVKFVSTNTDGHVVIYKKEYQDKLQEITKQWETITQIEMEYTDYIKYIRRDVNNYMTIMPNGKVKQKGIFELEKELHKDFSFQIISIALNEYFLNDTPVEQTIKNHDCIYDFLGTIRVQGTKQGTWSLYHSYIKNKKHYKDKLQKINRYYITSNPVHNIVKVLDQDENKWSYIQTNRNVIPLNKVNDKSVKDYNIDYNFYIAETIKIINKIDSGQQKIKF